MLRSQSWDLSIFANVFYFNRLSGNCRERNSTSDDLSSSFSKSAVYFYWFHVEFVYFWNLINDGLPNVLYWLTIVSSFKPRVLNRMTYRFAFALAMIPKIARPRIICCPICQKKKAFVSTRALNTHLSKKHPEEKTHFFLQDGRILHR